MSKYDPNQPSEYDGIIAKAADSAGVSGSLLRKLIFNESSFNPRAQSKTGPRGLGQFTKATGAAYGLVTDEDFFNPEKSADAAARHLSQLVDKFQGDELKAALAYNQGEGRVGKAQLDAYDKGDFGAISEEGRNYMRKLTDVAQSSRKADLEAFGGITPKAKGIPAEEGLGDIGKARSKVGDTLPESHAFTAPGVDIPKPNKPFAQLYFEEHGETLEDANDRSTFHGFKDAAEAALDNSVAGMAFRASRRDNSFDLFKDILTPTAWNSHQWSPEELEKIRSQVKDPAYIGVVTGGSPENLDALIKMANENYEADAKASTAGLGAKLSAGVLGAAGDPLTYVPIVGQASKGLNIVRKALTVGAQAGVLNVASEGLRTSIAGGDAHYKEALLGGFVFGAGMSALMDGLGKAAGKAVHQPQNEYAPIVGRMEAREAAINSNGVDTSALPAGDHLDYRETSSGVVASPHPTQEGAVVLADGSTLGPTNPLNPLTLDEYKQVAPERSRAGVSLGGFVELGQKLHRSETPEVRGIANDLLRPIVGAADGSNGKFGSTASDIHGRLHNDDRYTYNQLFEAVGAAMRDPEWSTGAFKTSRTGARQEIFKRVALAIERPELQANLTDAEKKVMGVMKDHFDHKRELMERPSIFGNGQAASIFPGSRHKGTYVPNVYSREAKQLYTESLGGADNLQEAIAQSWLTSYHARPEVKKRVDEFLSEEAMAEHKSKVAAAKSKMRLEDNSAFLLDKAEELSDVLKNAVKRTKDREKKLQNTQDRIKAHEDKLEDLRDQLAAKPDSKTLPRRIAEREAMLENQRSLERQNQERLDHTMSLQKETEGRLNAARKAHADAKAKEGETTEAPSNQPPAVTLEMVEAYARKKAYGIAHSDKFNSSSVIEDNLEGLVGIENNSFLEARNLFDSDMPTTLPDGNTFSVNDLRDFDMKHIMPAYDRRVNGDIAIMGGTGKTTKELKDLIVALGKRADSNGKLKGEVKALQDTIKILTGRARRNTDGPVETAIRSLSDLGFVAKNAYMGIQNYTEIAGMLAKGNVGAIFNGVPMVGKWMNRNKALSNTEQRDIANILFGKEFDDTIRPTRQDIIQRMRESSDTNGAVANVVGSIKFATGELAARSPWTKLLNGSGNHILNVARQGFIADMGEAALRGKKVKWAKDHNLKSASVSKEQYEAGLQAFRDHAVLDEATGQFTIKDKRALKNDPRVMSIWRLADRMADDTIMRPHKVSAQDSKAYGAGVKLAMQFKNFTIKSLNARFMRDVARARKDGRALDTALTWMLSMGLAGTYYVGAAHMKAQGLQENQRKEYLKKALAPNMIGYAALSRSAQAGAPMSVVNLIGAPLGFDQGKMVRSTINPKEDTYTPPNKAVKGRQVAGDIMGAIGEQIPGAQWAGSAGAVGLNALGLYKTNNRAEQQDYRTGIMNSLREIVPNDPLTQQMILHTFNEMGVNYDESRGKKH